MPYIFGERRPKIGSPLYFRLICTESGRFVIINTGLSDNLQKARGRKVFFQALDTEPSRIIESWCNKVAAEVLVPSASLKHLYNAEENTDEALRRLARYFKVSRLVILRRIYDREKFDHSTFHSAYEKELNRALAKPQSSGSGGNFYSTLKMRVGHRFVHAVVNHTLEGQTSYTEALGLLEIRKTSTFHKLAKIL